jgi:YebC/PmpR family DNA-binding regulatory protein
MSGHNKWSKIKRKKALTDAKKSKVFSKLVLVIQMESKKAKGDINSPSLKIAIERAKKENVPKENIDRAIKKGLNSNEADLENVLYEAYGPGGVAIMIETLTDNKNRTSSEIKQIFSKHEASLSAPGSASWAFEKRDGLWEPKVFCDLKKLRDVLEEQGDIQDVFINTN